MANLNGDQPHPLDRRAGVLIRTRRREIGMSQQELAAALGVSFQQVQKYENGANRISYSRLVHASRALKVRPVYFFEGLEADDADPLAAPGASEFLRSADGQTLAQAATRLGPEVRRAIADLARSLASQTGAA